MKRWTMVLTLVVGVLSVGLFGCDWRPQFSQEEINNPELGKNFPKGFLFGAATSAYQIEGSMDNDWTEWEKQKNKEGQWYVKPSDDPRCPTKGQPCSGKAADSWNRWQEDIKLLEELGANSYRLGIEWSRLEPQEGKFDDAAFNRYREMLKTLREKNITPMVTLYHFTLPKWFAEKGRWEDKNDKALFYFERFAAEAAKRLGDQVDLWATINEPNVYAFEGYLFGEWPPGVKDNMQLTAKIIATLLKAHGVAAQAIRKNDTTDIDGDGKGAQVGIVHHVRISQPSSSFALDHMIGGLTDDFFNEAIIRAVTTGKIYLFVPGDITIEEDFEPLKGSSDFIGINYYTRDHIRTDFGDPSLSKQYVPKGSQTNDLGWDIYAGGLYQTLMRFSRYKLPLYITENGTADEKDTIRPTYMKSHLVAMQRAIEHGADVRGYFHWSLIDNFEWAIGYNAYFGLFRVDPATQNRTPRTESVTTFQNIARNMGLNPQPR